MLDATTNTPAKAAEGVTISADDLRAIASARGAGTNVKDVRRWVRSLVRTETHARPINGPTAKPPGVRVATLADEPALLQLMMRDVQDNALRIAAPSTDRVLEHIQLGTRPSPKKMPAILGIIEGPQREPVAAILLLAFQWWWSQAFFLQETFAYVHPDHRGSRHAAHLMNFAKWCSDNMSEKFGYPVWLFQGVTAHEGVQRKMLFYSQHTNQIGGLYLYPCPWNDAR
jgi:hypothetical protein